MKISTILSRIPLRLRYLIGFFLMLLLIFVAQKAIFMLYNMGKADDAPFFSCLASLWYGLHLDIVTACYLTAIPLLLVIVSCFVRLPLRRIAIPYYVLICLVFTLLFIVDLVLYSYWGAKPDANDLIYAAKPKEMLAGLPVWFTILGFVVVGLLVWGCVMLLRWVTPRTLMPLKGWRSRLKALLYLPLGALLFLGMRGSVSESTANPSYAYFSSYPFCNHAALNPTFSMFHSLFKIQDLAKEFESMPDEEVDAILGDIFEPDATLTDTLLRIEHPNILLIIWEGGGKGMVGGNDTISPNFCRLISEGVYFSNCYSSNFRTDRGIVSVLSGWLGLPTSSLVKRPDLCRNLPSLASTLKAEGYSTTMTFGGDIDYADMRLYFVETGFSSATGFEKFPSSLNTGAWGVPDEYVLTPSVLIPDHGPFFSTVLTLSSHEPWDVNYHRLPTARENAFAYTDSCIAVLVDSLKTTPLWDSLLIVIVPDHGVPNLPGESFTKLAAAEIPLLWLGGALSKPCVVDCMMNQSDLAATLLAQMHLDVKPFVFSRNVLGTKYPERKRFAVHAVKNRLTYIAPDTIASYDCISHSLEFGAPDDGHFIEALLQRVYKTSAALSSR